MNRLGRVAWAIALCFTARQLPAQTPVIAPGGIFNAASYARPAVLSPGVAFAIYGTSLGSGTAAAISAPLPVLMAGASVLVNGVTAPLFYVSPGLISAQFPLELTGITTASVQVRAQSSSGTVTSQPVTVPVAPYSPGIFTLDQNGTGPGAIFRAHDLTPVCPPGRPDCSANPAAPGEVVTIYMTGLGAVTGPVPSGQLPQLPTFTAAPVSVTIGGTQAQVLFAGLSWAAPGLYQVDVIVPAALSPADSVPLTVSIAGTPSNPVTIAIGIAIPTGAILQGKGPLAEAVTAIALDPVHHYTLYAGTATSGVYRSTDAGLNWTPLSNGLPAGPVSVLVIDPSDPAVVYAGIHQSGPNDGAYKSTDAGAHWAPIRNGLTRGISAMVIDPQDSNTLYADTTGSGVYKSIDGGGIWTVVNDGLYPAGNVLAIDPVNSGTVYAANFQGFYKSTDGAASWSFNRVPAGVVVSALVIDALSPATLYAGTSGNGVFRSSDGGATWSAVGLPAAYVGALALDPLHTSTLFAGSFNDGGVLKSTDGGANWNPTTIGSGSVNALVIDPLNPSVVYAATSFGFSRSFDAGASWSATRSAFANTSLTALAIDPVNPSTLYAGAEGRGVLKSIDGGANWTSSLFGGSVNVLAIDPLNPANIYASALAGIFRSSDGGLTWKAANSGITAPGPFLYVTSLAVDPRHAGVVYAGTSNGPNALFRSSDGGENWAPLAGVALGVVWSLAINPLDSATLYAGGQSGPSHPNAFLSKSTNGGAAWTPLDSTPQPLAAVLIDPQNPSTLYVRTVIGITLKSTNGGINFDYIGHGTPPVNALAIDPVSPATLYTATDKGVIYKSTNGGGSWALSNNGVPASTNVGKLAVDPHSPATIYAATSNQGILKTTDAGATWQPTGLK